MPYDSAWVIITTCAAVYDAQVACDLLKRAGISALFRTEHAAHDIPRPEVAARGVDVLVPADRERVARKLLASDAERT